MIIKIKNPQAAFARPISTESAPREAKSEYCKLKTDIRAAAKVVFLAAKCKGLLSFDHLNIPKAEEASEYTV